MVAGQGCVHAWCSVCFALMLALCVANVLVGFLVWMFVWVWLVRVAVYKCLVHVSLQAVWGLGRVVFMYGLVCVFPYRLALCLANVLVGCLVCWLCVWMALGV